MKFMLLDGHSIPEQFKHQGRGGSKAFVKGPE
jgi:hypothetical protein